MKVEEIKNKTKDAVEYLVKSLEAGHTEVLTQYLAAMGRFHTYSFGNICLIARQRPSATNVAGVRAWNSLGRVVKKGEKGIMILAPMIGYRQRRQEETVAGETATEAQAAPNRIPKRMGFRYDYLVICGRAFARSMYAASATLGSPLDSSKHIIAQLLCPVQRSLMQRFQLSTSFAHQSGF